MTFESASRSKEGWERKIIALGKLPTFSQQLFGLIFFCRKRGQDSEYKGGACGGASENVFGAAGNVRTVRNPSDSAGKSGWRNEEVIVARL